jgi:hypothetical protein
MVDLKWNIKIFKNELQVETTTDRFVAVSVHHCLHDPAAFHYQYDLFQTPFEQGYVG